MNTGWRTERTVAVRGPIMCEDLRRWNLLALYLRANRSVPQYVSDEDMHLAINQLFDAVELPFDY